MLEGHDILATFRREIQLDAVDPDALLGESIDALLGFSSIHEDRDPEADMPDASSSSWQRDPASYGSTTEYRFQALSQSILSFARTTFKVDNLPLPDSVCVRIVEREDSSPSTRRLAGYHYVLIPSGFIKSLENIWRVQFFLEEKGRRFPASNTVVRSNHIGGASVERALISDLRNSWRAMDTLFVDAGWRRWYGGSMVFPEGVLAAGARATAEFFEGIYSTEGKPDIDYRILATPESRWLTRLVLAYVVAHEMAHIIFRHEDVDENAPSADLETRCDMFATYYFPYFVEHDARGWEAARDGGTEHLAGVYGFFAAVQIKQTIGLILGLYLEEFSEADEKYTAISSRMTDFERRAMNQAGILLEMIRLDKVMSSFAADVLSEFQCLLVGVQMVGTRMLLHQESSFASHFSKWKAGLQRHMDGMAAAGRRRD